MKKLYGPKFWGEKLNCSSSTAKRRMIDGTIPDARQTKGGHWRAPYSFFILQEVLQVLEDKEQYYDRAVSPELLRPFEGVFEIHSPVNKRRSLPYRIEVARHRARHGLPVTLAELDFHDAKFRGILANNDWDEAVKQAGKRFDRAWMPPLNDLTFCRCEVLAGRVKKVILDAAYLLATGSCLERGTRKLSSLALEYYRILKGKKLTNVANQVWEVDENDVLRPRLSWVEGSKSSFYRAYPKAMHREARQDALKRLCLDPPPLPEPKRRNTTHRDDLYPAHPRLSLARSGPAGQRVASGPRTDGRKPRR